MELWEDVNLNIDLGHLNMILTIQNHAWESAVLKQCFGWFQGIGAPQSLDESFMVPWDEGDRLLGTNGWLQNKATATLSSLFRTMLGRCSYVEGILCGVRALFWAQGAPDA